MTLLTLRLKELKFGSLYATLLAYLDVIEEKIGENLPDEPFRRSLEGLEAPLVAEIVCFTLMFSLPFGGGFVHGHTTYRVLSHFDLKRGLARLFSKVSNNLCQLNILHRKWHTVELAQYLCDCMNNLARPACLLTRF